MATVVVVAAVVAAMLATPLLRPLLLSLLLPRLARRSALGLAAHREARQTRHNPNETTAPRTFLLAVPAFAVATASGTHQPCSKSNEREFGGGHKRSQASCALRTACKAAADARMPRGQHNAA
eukprot:m.185273 g.185273  ORF g.185273 m.185273 type:complete len:123 (+) comp18115_c0_seq1:757-1125(+)